VRKPEDDENADDRQSEVDCLEVAASGLDSVSLLTCQSHRSRTTCDSRLCGSSEAAGVNCYSRNRRVIIIIIKSVACELIHRGKVIIHIRLWCRLDHVTHSLPRRNLLRMSCLTDRLQVFLFYFAYATVSGEQS